MTTIVHLSIDQIQDEVRQYINKGMICRCDPISKLCRCFPEREWPSVEMELSRNDFLLCDHVVDLLGHEEWLDD